MGMPHHQRSPLCSMSALNMFPSGFTSCKLLDIIYVLHKFYFMSLSGFRGARLVTQPSFPEHLSRTVFIVWISISMHPNRQVSYFLNGFEGGLVSFNLCHS